MASLSFMTPAVAIGLSTMLMMFSDLLDLMTSARQKAPSMPMLLSETSRSVTEVAVESTVQSLVMPSSEIRLPPTSRVDINVLVTRAAERVESPKSPNLFFLRLMFVMDLFTVRAFPSASAPLSSILFAERSISLRERVVSRSLAKCSIPSSIPMLPILRTRSLEFFIKAKARRLLDWAPPIGLCPIEIVWRDLFTPNADARKEAP
mmetsp:Transcript_11520/g.23617  ORF Transcript_11520/g.23617 Transcript_11520/m.23617 type:complete len:206 (+) Transcript_11520:177-794(+)